MDRDWHYCKWCDTEFPIRVPKYYSGDAMVKCPNCGWKHYRQFEAGIAISCNPPTGKYITIEAVK